MGTPLGDFIRARRDATPPEAVGLPAGSRRRVPGLRRSELASLAGISVEYLVRIEQGRDRNPSSSVVAALATALQFDAAEQAHLRRLVKIASGVCVATDSESPDEIRGPVFRLLEMLEPGVAYVSNQVSDILAVTSGFTLLAPSSLLDEGRPNLTRFLFTDPRAREVFPDWAQVADHAVAELQACPPRTRTLQFMAELRREAGEEFVRRLSNHDLPARGVLRWHHTTAGDLRFDREILALRPEDEQHIVVLVPADDATADALDGLRRSSSGGLRAVR